MPTATGSSAQLADEPVAVGILHVNPSFERGAVVQAEELVRVARKAVPTGHLTAPIRIHSPAERHRAAVELVHEIFRSKLVIFNAAPFIDRDAEPLRHSRRRHPRLHRLCSPWSRHLLSLQTNRKARGSLLIPGLLSYFVATCANLRRRLHRAWAHGPREDRRHRCAAAVAAPRPRRGFCP